MISDWKVKNMYYRHRTKQEMTVSVQESIFRVGDHKKKNDWNLSINLMVVMFYARDVQLPFVLTTFIR